MKYKLKILSVYKMHYVYCDFVEFSTDGIVFKKDNKMYYLDGKDNLLLKAYENLNNKWVQFYDYNTSYGMINKEDK
jgi:hypothetical protein